METYVTADMDDEKLRIACVLLGLKTVAAASIAEREETVRLINEKLNQDHAFVVSVPKFPEIPLGDFKLEKMDLTLTCVSRLQEPAAPPSNAITTTSHLASATSDVASSSSTAVASSKSISSGEEEEKWAKQFEEEIYPLVHEKNNVEVAAIKAKAANESKQTKKKILADARTPYYQWFEQQVVKRLWEKYCGTTSDHTLIGAAQVQSLKFTIPKVEALSNVIGKAIYICVKLPGIEKDACSLLSKAKQLRLLSLSQQLRLEYTNYYLYVDVDRNTVTPEQVLKLKTNAEQQMNMQHGEKPLFNKGRTRSLSKVFEAFHAALVNKNARPLKRKRIEPEIKVEIPPKSTPKRKVSTKDDMEDDEDYEESESDHATKDDDDDEKEDEPAAKKAKKQTKAKVKSTAKRVTKKIRKPASPSSSSD